MVVTLGVIDAQDLFAIHQLVGPHGIRVAAMQGTQPTLVDVLTGLIEHNPDQPIQLIGYNRAGAGATRSWLKRVAGFWLRHHPQAQVYVSTTLVNQPALPEIRDAIGAKVRPVTGGEAGLTNPTWQDPPPHDAHLLICQGPRCLAQGAKAVADNLYPHLQDQGIADQCLTTLTGCLYPCNRAPVVCVQPYQQWVEVDPNQLDAFAIKVKTLISTTIQHHDERNPHV